MASTLTSTATLTLDALYKQELATADPGLRQQLFRQIHQIYLTDFPFITLYCPPRSHDRAQGDAQLPAQPLCWRDRQHLGVVVRRGEVLGEEVSLNEALCYFLNRQFDPINSR